MDLTIIIPFFNGYDTISHLIKAIPNTFKILVVNDLSDSGYESTKSNVTVLNLNKKGYFTGAVNEGIKACSTDVLILNQDVMVTDALFA